MVYPASLQKLIDALCVFPGIGPKTAQRLAFYLLARPREEVAVITRAMLEARDRLRFCTRCGCLTEKELCSFCTGDRRDRTLLCVVSEPRDVLAMERTGRYRGLYQVLHGALSPLDGLGPDELRLPELVRRVETERIQEVIIATNPTVEGDATAVYIARLLQPLRIKVTRIGFGLPVGADLEYADDLTLSRALEGRREI